jgi:hypothetical protein
MAKYEVKLEWYETIENVEADSEEEAIAAAKQEIIDEHNRFVTSPAEEAIEFMDSYVSTNHYALCTEDDEEETEDD